MTKLMRDVFPDGYELTFDYCPTHTGTEETFGFIFTTPEPCIAICDAVNNHDTLTEQNRQLVDMLFRVNDNYQQNLTKRSRGEPVDFGTDGEVNRVWVEVPLLKEIELFLAKHKDQI